jgi:hypothetical protein
MRSPHNLQAITAVTAGALSATDVHPSLDESATQQEKQHTQVFVDVSCPSHD